MKTVGGMLVKDIMTSGVHSVTLRDTVQDVLRRAHNKGVSGFPVVDDNGGVIGMVSTIDLLIDAAVDKLTHQLGELPLTIAAEKEVITVSPESPVKEALLMIVKKRIGRVLVVDEAGKLCGIVTRGDLIRFVVDNLVPAGA